MLVFLISLIIPLVSSQITVSNSEVAEVNYDFKVENGEAVVTVPIHMPKGVNGLMPKLDLIYRSNQYLVNNEIGAGWQLSGLSEITRCTKSFHFENSFGSINYNYSDVYCYNGQRLRLASGLYGYSGSEYKTEIDDYKKVIAYGAQNSGPRSFKAFTKDNLIITFGDTDDSLLSPMLPNGRELGVISKWLVSKIEDYSGNAIHFKYLKEKNFCYLNTINYSNRKVSFSYESRTDIQTKYYRNYLDLQISKRLKHITFSVDNKDIKELVLGYVSYGTVGISLLKTVKVCSLNSCTKPLEFNYDTEAKGKFSDIQYVNAICGENSVCELRQVVDMNSDGLADIVGFGNDGVYVSLNNGNGFSLATRWTTQFGRTGWTLDRHVRYIADMNKDGFPDIIGFADDGVYVSLNQNGYFKLAERWILNYGYNQGYRVGQHVRTLADINNDGFLDVVINNDNGLFVSFNDNGKRLKDSEPTYGAGHWAARYGWGSTDFFQFGDLNGDGLKDIVGFHGYVWLGVEFGKDSISGVATIQGPSNVFTTAGGWKSSDHTRFLADINNDNLDDIIGFNGRSLFIGTAGVDANLKNFYTVSLTSSSFPILDGKTKVSRDVNGDGFLDIVAFDCSGVYVSLNTGKGFQEPTLWSTDIKSCDSEPRDSQDLNGDLIPDLIGFYGSTAKITYNLNKQPLLLSVTDTLGNQKKVSYGTLAVQNKKTNITVQQSRIYLNMNIVSSLASSDGVGGNNKIAYQYGPYTCGIVQGRFDCSFEWIRSENFESKIAIVDHFESEYPIAGILKRKTGYYDNTMLYDKKFEYLVRNKVVSQVRDFALSKTENKVYELNGMFLRTEHTDFTYDDYGNLLKSVESIQGDNSSFTRTKIFTYKNDAINWFIGELVEKTESNSKMINNNIISSRIKEEAYKYNRTTRLLIQRLYQQNDDVGLEESFVHDKFGNIVSVQQKALQSFHPSDTRKKYFTYDSNGLNVLSKKNDLLQEEYFKYDEFDSLIEHKDVNGIISRYYYDHFGRKIQEIDYQKKMTSWFYEWDSPQSTPNSVYKITSVIENTLRETSYYDSLNRLIRKTKLGFKGEVIAEDTIYNTLGQLVRKSAPYRLHNEKPVYVTFEYDALYRETKRTEFKRVITTEYNGYKTVKSDQMGRMTISKKNIMDEIITIEDAQGSVAHYDYDTFGNLIKIVDPQGSTIRMSYNMNDQKIMQDDPFMGITHYTYNAFNELVVSKHTKGKEIRFQRDSLGRLILRNELEGNTSWIYDTAKNGIGKLHKIRGPNDYYSENFYDQYGRVIEQIYKYDTKTNYKIKSEYDKLGRIVSQTYPSGDTIYECYNNFGYLSGVSMDDPSCRSSLWKSLDYDARDNILKEQYDNDIITDYTLSEDFQVTKIVSTNGMFNNVMRRLEYEYDRRQNLVSRSDYDPRGKLYVQKYSYDLLNRLVSASNYETINRKLEFTQSSSWMYDSVGNLLFTHNPNEISYKYDDTKPQLAVKIGAETVKYDFYGNVIQTDAYKIDWYSFSKAQAIRTSKQNITFEYGPERDLIVKKLDNGATTIHYIGDRYEKWVTKNATHVKTTEKIYFRVQNKIVATKVITEDYEIRIGSNNDKEETLLFMHYDAFENLESISDDSGNLVLKYNYTAFGKAQVMYSNLTPRIANVLSHGFGGHDHIDSDRLINMNGRLFDSLFLRFLSPDPYIQDVYNIQNLNRYSYALNNPFKYNDPSGFFWSFVKKIFTPKVLIGIAIGIATAGLASAIIAPALITSIGIASTSLTATVLTGAIVGATSAFTSTLYVTDGNLKASLQAAAIGGVVGGVGAGVLSKTNFANVPKQFTKEAMKFAISKTQDGVINLLEGKKFFDGFDVSAISFVSSIYFKSFIGFEKTIESGKETYLKGLNSVKSAINENGLISTVKEFGKQVNNIYSNSKITLSAPGIPITVTFSYGELFNHIKCSLL